MPVASALIAIGVWLGKRAEPAAERHSVLPSVSPADLDAVRRIADAASGAAQQASGAAASAAARADAAASVAGAARQLADGMLPRLGRAEQDIQDHASMLRVAEINLGKIGERLRAKLEAHDGRRRDSE